MSKKTNSSTGGVSVLGLLGVAFVVLKLCGVINWSWWLVTLPFWGGLVLLLGIIAGIFAVAGLGWLAVFILSQIEKRRGR